MAHRIVLGWDHPGGPPPREATCSHRSEREENASARFGRDDSSAAACAFASGSFVETRTHDECRV